MEGLRLKGLWRFGELKQVSGGIGSVSSADWHVGTLGFHTGAVCGFSSGESYMRKDLSPSISRFFRPGSIFEPLVPSLSIPRGVGDGTPASPNVERMCAGMRLLKPVCRLLLPMATRKSLG